MATHNNDDFASCSLADILHIAKNVVQFKFERTEHQALIKELGFRLKTLKEVTNRF